MVSAPLGTMDDGEARMPVREFAVNGYIALVLAGEAAIREEWTAMRNCALEYATRCEDGAYRVVSLRDRETGERVVTVVLKRQRGRYVALDVRRRFNRPAGPEVWTVAQRTAFIYSGAGAAARRAERCGRSRRVLPHCGEPIGGPQAAFDFGVSRLA